MGTLTNSPQSRTVLRLERRKSFSVGLWIRDHSGKPLDISGCSIRMSVQGDGDDNLIASDEAVMASPEVGYARFDLQSADLDVAVNEYPFVITLIDSDGYSSAIVKGTLDVQDNPEHESVSAEYETANPPTTLHLLMRGQQVLEVKAGPALAPGTTSFSLAEQEKLGQMVAEAQLPPGGYPGNVLARVGTEDYQVQWVQPTGGGGGGSGIDPTGVPAGYVPTSLGSDSWNWEPLPPSGVVTINGEGGNVEIMLADLEEDSTHVTITSADRTKVQALDTASARPEEFFRRSADLIGDADINGVLGNAKVPKLLGLRGVQYGSTSPSAGWSGTPEAGDVYFQLEA